MFISINLPFLIYSTYLFLRLDDFDMQLQQYPNIHMFDERNESK